MGLFDWMIDRLREPSTYKGLTGLLSAIGISVSPEMTAQIAAVGISVVSFIEIFRRELPTGV
jgi:hypothetical protein